MSRRGIGLVGGTFDPVHKAHIELAHRALAQVGLKEIWFIPAWQPPNKDESQLTASEHRLAMLELAIVGRKRLAICTIELEQEEVVYTAHTVDALSHTHLGERFYLLLGEDNLRDLPRWREPTRLLEMATPVVMPRAVDLKRSGAFGAGGRRESTVMGVPIIWLSGEPLDLSSTRIREALRAGKRPGGLNDAVYEYITHHDLYRESMQE